MSKRYLRGCSVAVVGGAGFLGSHLVNHLIDDRLCRVTVIDNLITGRREFIHPRAEFIWADITHSESYLRQVFEQREVKYVFNYAAEPYIPVSFARPLHVFDINAFGALKVINAAQEAGCLGILQVSSAEIYGNQQGKIAETAAVEPHSSYGAAKAAIDAMVQVRWAEAQTPVIALRQFNCVGERETHPYVVPEIITQITLAREGRSPKVQGQIPVWLGNNSSRDFMYAGDAVRQAATLLERGHFGHVYNLGSEESIGIYDLALLVGKLMGVQVGVVTDQARVRPWEIWHLQSDNSKLYETIGKPNKVTPLEGALQLAIDWHEGNGSRWPWEPERPTPTKPAIS